MIVYKDDDVTDLLCLFILNEITGGFEDYVVNIWDKKFSNLSYEIRYSSSLFAKAVMIGIGENDFNGFFSYKLTRSGLG